MLILISKGHSLSISRGEYEAGDAHSGGTGIPQKAALFRLK